MFNVLRRPESRMRLEVSVPPTEVMKRLAVSMTLVKHFLLSPAWGNTEEFIGQLGDSTIRMRVRHGYSNGLTRLLYGTVTATRSGSLLHLRFRTLWVVEAILRAIWVIMLLAMGFEIIDAPSHPGRGGPAQWRHLGLSLVGPAATLMFVVVIEALARRLGDADERRMRRHINDVFADVCLSWEPAADAAGRPM